MYSSMELDICLVFVLGHLCYISLLTTSTTVCKTVNGTVKFTVTLYIYV